VKLTERSRLWCRELAFGARTVGSATPRLALLPFGLEIPAAVLRRWPALQDLV
jgi:hypothetical protein